MGYEIVAPTALYIDLEMTFWDKTPPAGMQPEIIEIGVVEMDLATLTIVQEAQMYVRPKRWAISERCAEMTGITEKDVRAASPLPAVLDRLKKKFAPAGKRTVTWGDDVLLLERACTRARISNPFRRQLDLSRLYRELFLLEQSPSLTNALKRLGMEFEGTPHGALPDARNTAAMHARILQTFGPIQRTQMQQEAPLEPEETVEPALEELVHELALQQAGGPVES